MALSIVSMEHQGQTRTAFFSDVSSFGSSALISTTFNFVKIFALNYLDKVILRKHSIDPGTESTLTLLEIRASTETAATHRTANHENGSILISLLRQTVESN